MPQKSHHRLKHLRKSSLGMKYSCIIAVCTMSSHVSHASFSSIFQHSEHQKYHMGPCRESREPDEPVEYFLKICPESVNQMNKRVLCHDEAAKFTLPTRPSGLRCATSLR